MKIEYGYVEGETCNRSGCNGVIEEFEKGGCSCHIAAPCSSCEEDRSYCPICNWSGKKEQEEEEKKYDKVASNYYKKNPLIEFKEKTLADLDNTKIDYVRTFGGYYNYTYEGVYPEGTTLDEVKEAIGWVDYFGGIVHSFGDGKFKIKIYTD